MDNKYDVIIVGAGPGGIYCAYELAEKTDLKILLIDKGLNIYRRRCPILEGKIDKCPSPNNKKNYAGCLPACSITDGFGGSGAYSDGKFNITTEFGGWLDQKLENKEVLKLINEVDNINLKHGATKTITDPTTPEVEKIERRGYAKGLKLLRSKVRHLGTEVNLEIMKSIYEYLKPKIEMKFRTEVSDIIEEDKKIKGVILNSGEELYAENVVIVPGRDGSAWLEKILSKRNISSVNNQVDIGVRVETSDVVMQEINKHLYEGKFIFETSVGTRVRTFCSNPSGHVVVENHSGTMLANGHAYKDSSLGSNNTNFALLVSHEFTEPFKHPNQFAHEIGKLANQVTNGSIIVQRYGDILRGRRTTQKRLKEGFINPTQTTAIPSDLGLVLPYNTMKSLIEMIEALDHVTPGIASEHTLFYGVEAKFYSSRFNVDKNFETEIKGLFLGGDGSGYTRGLAQAGANGMKIAKIIGKIK